jgi:hypothetical protein
MKKVAVIVLVFLSTLLLGVLMGWAAVEGPRFIYKVRNERFVRETVELILYEKGLIE